MPLVRLERFSESRGDDKKMSPVWSDQLHKTVLLYVCELKHDFHRVSKEEVDLSWCSA